jgi:outer membrane protein OmpA-like peptidoglycan-associated protein
VNGLFSLALAIRNRASLEDTNSPVTSWNEISNAHPQITKVAVVGHTSPDERAGQRLGEGRAKAVVAVLAKSGIDVVRLVPQGYGSERPIADNATLEGRQRNRRVEFSVLEQNGCPVP